MYIGINTNMGVIIMGEAKRRGTYDERKAMSMESTQNKVDVLGQPITNHTRNIKHLEVMSLIQVMAFQEAVITAKKGRL